MEAVTHTGLEDIVATLTDVEVEEAARELPLGSPIQTIMARELLKRIKQPAVPTFWTVEVKDETVWVVRSSHSELASAEAEYTRRVRQSCRDTVRIGQYH